MTVLLSYTTINAQVKNAHTVNVKISGNCGMCKTTIEKAGNVKKLATVLWDKDTKMATITYDSNKTNEDEILKRIALAGYDSEKFLAPDDVYAKLHGCCKYDREHKSETAKVEVMEEHSMHNHNGNSEKPTEPKQEVNQLKTVFDNYYLLKDALVASNGTLAASSAKELFNSIVGVQMNTLSHEEHTAWMKVMKDLKLNAEHIEKTKDAELQREIFIALSDNMYQLIKVSKQETPVYYQHCPMANKGKGANWLSKENTIKNPYYGSAMLTCGKTIETIK